MSYKQSPFSFGIYLVIYTENVYSFVTDHETKSFKNLSRQIFKINR